MYLFVNQKTVNNKEYLAERDDKNPKDIRITITDENGEVETIFPKEKLSVYWANIK